MKQLLYLIMSLVVIAAIIPGVSAVQYQEDHYGIPYGNDTWLHQPIVEYYSFGYCCLESAKCYGGPGVSMGVLYKYNYVSTNECPNGLIRNLTNYAWSGSAYDRWDRFWNETDPNKGEINFTGTPTTGPAPLVVSFSTVNVTNSTGLSWSFGDGNVTTTSVSPLSHLYQNQGTYTVRLDYFNSSGYPGSIQKNNYITVGAPNATKTKYFQTIDGTNGNIVLNSSIQLNDIENTSWVNATGLSSDGMSHITTLEGHHINAYAQALGYSDADDLNILNDGNPQYIMMWPTFAKNVSAGNVSLYVTVKDKDTKANLFESLVKITLSNGDPAQQIYTNEAGIAYFIVSNNTLASVTAYAGSSGYAPGTTTINTGIGSGGSSSAAVTILLSKKTVTPTTAVTTLPGQPGVTPTPTVTILPGCEDTISAEGQAKCRTAQSNQGLSFLAANMGDLIMICVFVTMLYLLGIKLGR